MTKKETIHVVHVLMQCIDALETLARIDDGTCSVTALNDARKLASKLLQKQGA